MPTTVLDRHDLFSLSEAARRLPGRPHRATLWRWARHGVMVPNGRLHLKVLRFGRRTFVAAADLTHFAEALGAAVRHQDQRTQQQRFPPKRITPHIATVREAERLGI